MKNPQHVMRDLVWACGFAAALALAGCGGGSDNNDEGGGTDPTPPVVTSPTAYYLDSVVLPASAIKAVAVAPQAASATVKATHILLPAMDTTKAEQAGLAGPAMQIGVSRAVAATSSVAQTQAAWQWQTQADGSQVAAINIESAGAYGLRAGVLVSSLPDSVQLRVYSQEHPNAVVQTSGAQVNALLAQNREAGEQGAAANTWWTPEVGTGNATLELVLPAGISASDVKIAIPTVSHIYQNMALPTEGEWADVVKQSAGSCNLDASCTSSYQAERNAVARMLFTSGDGKSYFCSGTLLNNTKGDYAPYFLTANHCISTQAEASSLQTTWFYRASSCGSSVPSANAATRTGGASLLYATATTDTTLLKLNDMPPAGVTLAGWDARNTAQVGSTIYGLHHPQGDMLKYSVGSIAGYTSCTSAGGLNVTCTTGDANSDFYRVQWSQGVTEGGSSGSALFNGGRVVGTLYAGSSSCLAPNAPDSYGRFDKVFSSKIWSWLAG